MKKDKVAWIIAHDGTKGADAYMLECLRCGKKQRVTTPLSVKDYVATAKAFEKIHKHCRPSPGGSERGDY